jgi:starvation-inducible outer membrane lipoprotein
LKRKILLVLLTSFLALLLAGCPASPPAITKQKAHAQQIAQLLKQAKEALTADRL